MIALFLTIVIVFSAYGQKAAAATSNTTSSEHISEYVGDGYKVTFQVTSSWSGAYNASITITNTGKTTIEDWCIEFPLQQKIQNIWNAIILKHENNLYTIKNDGNTRDIPVGKSISFGFQCKGEFTTFPDKYTMLGETAIVSTQNYDVSFKVMSDWGTGFIGQITITNKTDKAIEGWTLSFDANYNIDNIWNAYILSHEGTHYVLHNAGYNAIIEPHQSVTIGFQVNRGSSSDQIQNSSLTQIVFDKKDVSITIDNSNFEYSEKNHFYVVSNQLIKISGTLQNADTVDTLEYKITSITGRVISHGQISVAEAWSFAGFNLMYGTNTVTITATDRQGNKTVKSEQLYNTNIKNMGNLIDDTNTTTDLLAQDSDNDNLCDFVEGVIGTDPFKEDSDGNGKNDDVDDADGDGVSNKAEIEYYTNPITKDTDEDGLLDGEELYKYQTDPCKSDTDGDGASDKWEIEHNYDPLVKNNSFSASTSITVNDKIENVSVRIEGSDGSAAESLKISTVNNILFNQSVPGYIGDCTEFYANGTFESATVSYTLDESLFNDSSFVPTLYYFNESTQLLEEVPDQELTGNVVSATLPHFSKYILLNKTEFDNSWNYDLLYDEDGEDNFKGIDVVFAIDSSGSMSYNDSNNVRKTVTKNFFDHFTNDDRAAIVDFDNWAYVVTPFTSDKSTLEKAVDKIDSYGGTNLSSAISAGIDLFTSSSYKNDGHAKYIILLTDGEGDYSNIYTEEAQREGITIFTVGLGDEVSVDLLKDIATGTGGQYYHADEADKLYGIFDTIADKTDLYKDSDNDGLRDYYEKEMNNGNLRLGTGVKLTGLNYLNADSDDDNLLDGEEIQVLKVGERVYVYMKSNPASADTDGDGLLDGSAKIINNKKVAPKDPDPLYPNGPIGIWQAQFEREESGNIPTKYGDYAPIKLDLSIFTTLGARILWFKYDDHKEALHSQVSTWQSIGGYNDFYDRAFQIGTLGDMDKVKFPYTDSASGKQYIIWAWKGNYLNLGSGAEIGLYQKPHKLPIVNIIQWDVSSIRLPMTLNLYNYYGSDDIENIFSWAPEEAQWWITGFNPDYMFPDHRLMVSLGSIDYAGYPDLYNGLKNAVEKDNTIKDYMIFDEDGHTVWFIWWNNYIYNSGYKEHMD